MTEKPLKREALQSLYPPMTHAFAEQMKRLICSQPTSVPKPQMRIRIAIVITALLVLLGAVAAAALDWNVLTFLFGSQRDDLTTIVQPVHAEATDGQVKLTVSSALTDGEILALDWSIENADRQTPVFAAVDDFTVNGVRVFTDGNDSFDQQWLPGRYSRDGSMRNGERLFLPHDVKAADTLQVELIVGVYRSQAPIWQMETYDAQTARQKLDEGWFVIPEGEGFVMYDAAEEYGVVRALGMPTAAGAFTRTELPITFELDLRAGRESQYTLHTQESYSDSGFTLRYTKACVSVLGLYLTAEIVPDGAWEPVFETFETVRLTDGEGMEFGAPFPAFGEMSLETDAQGNTYILLQRQYDGLTLERLPDVIALTRFPQNGDALVFPVRVR